MKTVKHLLRGNHSIDTDTISSYDVWNADRQNPDIQEPKFVVSQDSPSMLSTLTLNESELVVKTVFRNNIFGCQGILMPERKHYLRPYSVVARKDTFLAAFTKSSYQRIQERIYKKYVN